MAFPSSSVITLLDSGAEYSFLPSAMAEGLILRPTLKSSMAYNGSPIPTLGVADVTFTFVDSNTTFTHPFYFADVLLPALGQDFLAQQHLKLCWEVFALLSHDRLLANFLVPSAEPRSPTP